MERRITILVVDDDVQLQALLRLLLERAGFDVDEAFDGRDGLSRMMACDYDTVLLDLMMPNLDGFGLLTLMRQKRPALLKRTVVCTAVSDMRLTGLDETEIYRVIRKPFDIVDLTNTLHRCAGQVARPVSELTAVRPKFG
jgi:DNA-binding response OmpR family regulator